MQLTDIYQGEVEVEAEEEAGTMGRAQGGEEEEGELLLTVTGTALVAILGAIRRHHRGGREWSLELRVGRWVGR